MRRLANRSSTPGATHPTAVVELRLERQSCALFTGVVSTRAAAEAMGAQQAAVADGEPQAASSLERSAAGSLGASALT